MGAEIRAVAREAAPQAQRDADRAEAELWSIRMEAFGGSAQASPMSILQQRQICAARARDQVD
jgi:hypothetical protein